MRHNHVLTQASGAEFQILSFACPVLRTCAECLSWLCGTKIINTSHFVEILKVKMSSTRKGLYFCRPSYPALQENHVRQPRCCCPTCPTLHPCEPFLATVLSMLQHFSQGKSLKKKGFIAHAPTNTSAKCNLKRIIIQGIIVPLPNTSYMMRSIYQANAATRIK